MSDPTSTSSDVLIVGAGPTGLTMACELRRQGVACRLIDQHSGPTPLNESRALGVQARTLEVFHSLGIGDRALAEGKRAHGISVHSGKRRILHLTLDMEGQDTAYPYVL